MANFKFDKVDTNDKRLLSLSGLSSIRIRDLSRIKTLAKMLLEEFKINSAPKSNEDFVKIDAYYTAVFIKYRRCFNGGKRGAGLDRYHVPKEYLSLHDYLIEKTDEFYAHALQEDNQLVHQVNIDTGKVVDLSAILKEDVQPLNIEALQKVCLLVDALQAEVQKKEIKIKSQKHTAINLKRV